MKVQIFRPKEFHPVVQEIRWIQSDDEQDTLTHFIPPLGAPEIILYNGLNRQIHNINCEKGLIKGQYTTTQKINLRPGYSFLCLVLHPFGIKQVFGNPAFELTNAVVDIEHFPWLREMASNLSTTGMIDSSNIVYLFSQLRQCDLWPIHSHTQQFVEKVNKNKAIRSVKEIADELGIQMRTLQRVFKNDVGMPPKEWLRINRLSLIEKRLGNTRDYFEIINEFEFTDQSHFIKEIRHFRTLPPGEVLKNKMLLSDQLPIPEIIAL